jgi:hypothetical protein
MTASNLNRVPCKRCHGAGFLDIDRAEPAPWEWCNRCEASGVEPLWADSPEAYEVAFRRVANEARVTVDVQDSFLKLFQNGVPDPKV